MISTNQKNYLILIFLAILLAISKYLVSYFLNFDESLFFKIIRLSEIDFFEYSLITESISRLDFHFDWNSIEPAQKSSPFPIFPVLWHSIFFIFFKHYTFLILEIVFYCLLIIFIFKSFLYLNENADYALIITVLLFLFLESLIFLNNQFKFQIFNVIQYPIYEFLSLKYPRPLVTSLYLFFTIYLIQNMNKYFKFKLYHNDILYLSISLILLIHSFYYFFVTCSLVIFIYAIYKTKKNFLLFLKKNSMQTLLFIFLIGIGLITLLIQINFAEEDYQTRIGVVQINFEDKIIILNTLVRKLFQVEILLIIISCVLIRFKNEIIFFQKVKNSSFDIFLIIFFASLISPFLFIIISNKVTLIYHWWTIVKFFGFLYIFIVLTFSILDSFFKNRLKNISHLFIIILVSLNFVNQFYKQDRIDPQLINDRNEVRNFLVKKNFKKTNSLFYTDEKLLINLWIELENKNFINENQFLSSQTDEQFEKIKMNMLKLFELKNDQLKKLLNENENKEFSRNIFAHSFGNKYSVNSFKHYKPLENEYSLNMVKKIKDISPLLWWYTYFPNSEKKRLIEKYKKFKLNPKLIPDIFILKNNEKNNSIKDNLNKYNIQKIYSNKNYILMVKN